MLATASSAPVGQRGAIAPMLGQCLELLGEDVLAGLESGKIPRAVQGIGERVVDRLDVTVGEDVGIGAEYSLHSVPSGEVLGATAAPSTPMRIGAAVALPVMSLHLSVNMSRRTRHCMTASVKSTDSYPSKIHHFDDR